MSAAVVITASGRAKALPDHIDPADVRGLDPDGRIVVQPFPNHPDLFGLTLCCNAYDKGTADPSAPIVCRRCYGTEPNADVGNYLWPNGRGEYPDLDPVTCVVTGNAVTERTAP